MTTQTIDAIETADSVDSTLGADALEAARAAADRAREVALWAGESVPPLAHASLRAIEHASDERIAAGVTFSLGLSLGLLIGGAPRLVTAAALLPLAAMGLALLDRRSLGGGRSGSPA